MLSVYWIHTLQLKEHFYKWSNYGHLTKVVWVFPHLLLYGEVNFEKKGLEFYTKLKHMLVLKKVQSSKNYQWSAATEEWLKKDDNIWEVSFLFSILNRDVISFQHVDVSLPTSLHCFSHPPPLLEVCHGYTYKNMVTLSIKDNCSGHYKKLYSQRFVIFTYTWSTMNISCKHCLCLSRHVSEGGNQPLDNSLCCWRSGLIILIHSKKE